MGDEVVSESCNDTIGAIQLDYPPLLEEVSQLQRYVLKKRSRGQEPTADELLSACSKGLLVGNGNAPGYAGLDDLRKFLKDLPTPFEFTRDLMAHTLGLRRSTIDTFLKPNRKKRKKSGPH